MSLSKFSILFVIISIIHQAKSHKNGGECQSVCEIYLSQSDFDTGTYRITNSGTYCIQEDITFDPNAGTCIDPNADGAWFPSNEATYPSSTTQEGGPFALGWFAVLTIETDDVVVDLCGKRIQYSFDFYLQQRWGSIIEIGVQPFVPDAGPADFGPNNETCTNIEVKNGKLGLSSHHGIHSNTVTNVKISDLQIRDFEVGAIQLNGFDGAVIENVNIGPSLTAVPLTAFYSNGRFILLAYRALLDAYDESEFELPNITFYGRSAMTLRQIANNLQTSMDLVYGVLTKCIKEKDVKNDPLYQAGKKLFINEEQLPDGAALYGIVLNSKSVAVNGFGDSENTETAHGQNATITNVAIKDLFLNVNEVPAVYFDKCSSSNATTISIQKGPFGDVFDLREAISESDAALVEQHGIDSESLASIVYTGNPLSDAQIALGIFGSFVAAGQDSYGFGSFIAEELANWAQGMDSFPSTCADFVCNGDIMFHSCKGVVAFRMDGIENAIMEDVRIKNVENRSPLVSNACGAYSGPHDGGTTGAIEAEGGMATDIRGLSVTGGDILVIGAENKIEKLNSFYGDTTGIDIMGNATVEFDDGSDIAIRDVRSAAKLKRKEYEQLLDMNQTPFPNNFDVCTINIEQGSQVIGDVPSDLDETECIEGTYDNKMAQGKKPKKAMQINGPFVDGNDNSETVSNGYYGMSMLQMLLLNAGVSAVVCLSVIAFCVTVYYCWMKWNGKKHSFKKIVEDQDEDMEQESFNMN